jgi:cytochrome c peroxidase
MLTSSILTARRPALVAALAIVFSLAGCKQKPPPPSEEEIAQATKPAAEPAAEPKPSATIDPAMLGAYAVLPEVMASPKNPITDAKIALGRMLYFDTRLSKNHDISCNSCHLLDKYGVDGKPVSPGHREQLGARNSPTVYNAAGHIAQFWDGRSADVEEQAKGPVLNPVEMAMPDEKSVVRVLKSIPGYVEAFKAAFPDAKVAVSYDNMALAIGAFERKLLTPSRWDKFLGGDKAALTDDEKRGFNKFVEIGCPTCHTGPYLGGHMYQKVGLVKPWPNQKDLGRFEVTKQETDKMFFKVPSLRNVDKTAPYFHDGSEPSLLASVKTMADHQLARQISDEDASLIVAWFGSLTGDLPTDYIKAPELPPSGKRTPKPDPT